jgi:hypothetical protein
MNGWTDPNLITRLKKWCEHKKKSTFITLRQHDLFEHDTCFYLDNIREIATGFRTTKRHPEPHLSLKDQSDAGLTTCAQEQFETGFKACLESA